ncbi:MAG TPA: hypothetical protein VFX30_03630 [bacterium]|nr:hypothetical protein [bacterium]
MIRRLLKLALVLLAVGQIAATCQGTETGNPGVPSEQPGGSGGGTTGGTGTGGGCPAALKSETAGDRDSVVDSLLLDLCHKIILCGVPTTTDTCVNALNGADGDRMTDEFGLLPEGSYTVDSLRDALNEGALSFNSSGFSSCEPAIGSVDCATVEANVTATDFSGTENIVPDVCFEVFGPVANDAEGGAPCP